jgi:hypothetical protein
MTRDDLATILQPIQNAGVDTTATAAAVLCAAVLSGYRRLGREEQAAILAQVTAEAWWIHDAAVTAEQTMTGRPLGLMPLRGLH